MNPKTFLISACMLAVAFAGCTDSPADNETVDDEGPGASADGLSMPTWSVGDWWTYESPFATGTLVVAADTGSAWDIATDNQEWAYYHANVEATSYMGEQRKSDLAGSQGSDAVQFFDWPLEDGKTWTTRWDGEDLTITANKLADTTYRMEGVAGDLTRVAYEYRAGVGWFQWMSFFDDEGAEQYRLDIRDSGSSYAGELVRVAAEQVYAQSGAGGVSMTPFDEFGASDDSDLYLVYSASCPEISNGNGAPYTFALGPVENIVEPTAQSDDGFNDADQCPHEEQFNGIIGLHPNEGTWGFVVEAPTEAEWSFELILREFERYTI